MARKVYRDGKWEEGKASPEHLREDLRQLPSTYVTKETDNPDQIHALDDPHIVGALTEEQQRTEGILPEAPKPEEPVAKKHLKQKSLFEVGKRLPLSSLNPHRRQYEIDLIRFKVIHGVISGLYQRAATGHLIADEEVTRSRYLDFPDDNLMEFGVKECNAPSNSDRPTYLVGMKLEIDLLNWPERVVDILKADNVPIPDPSDILNSLFTGLAEIDDGTLIQ